MDEDEVEVVQHRCPALRRLTDQLSSDDARPPTSESDTTGLNTSINNDEDEDPGYARTQRKVCPAQIPITLLNLLFNEGCMYRSKQDSSSNNGPSGKAQGELLAWVRSSLAL